LNSKIEFASHRWGLFWIVAVSLALGASSAAYAGTTYTVGLAPQRDQRDVLDAWAPILRDWEKRTGARFRFVGATDHRAFELGVEQGRYDFIYPNPYLAVIGARKHGYEPLVCSGKELLHGILVVRRDSPVTNPAQLDGARIAFSAPNAFAASILVRSDLKRRFGIGFKPVYVKTHSSVYLNVAQGLADAGGGVSNTLDLAPAEARSMLRVIHTTAGVAPHPLMAHPGVPRRVREQVRDAMLALDTTSEGRALLEKIPMPQPRKTSIGDYRAVEAMRLDEFFERSGS